MILRVKVERETIQIIIMREVGIRIRFRVVIVFGLWIKERWSRQDIGILVARGSLLRKEVHEEILGV